MDVSTRTVDVHLYIPGSVGAFQKKQLCGNDIGHFIIDGISEKNNPVHHQSAVHIHHSNIHRPFFNNIRCKVGYIVVNVSVQRIAADTFVLYSIFFKLLSKIHFYCYGLS